MLFGAVVCFLLALGCVVLALNPSEGGALGTTVWIIVAAVFAVLGATLLRQRPYRCSSEAAIDDPLWVSVPLNAMGKRMDELREEMNRHNAWGDEALMFVFLLVPGFPVAAIARALVPALSSFWLFGIASVVSIACLLAVRWTQSRMR
jgi:cobalamin biosynthesis protein CobD/CbiB